MKISVFVILLLVALSFPVHAQPQAAMPTMSSVDPESGKVGDVVVVTGANLDRESVAALYLTDGTTDVKVAIIEQTATSIKFRIPREAKPGRLALMVLTPGKTPKLIEEPVKISIEPETNSSAPPANRAG